jgi:hypothetical protein
MVVLRLLTLSGAMRGEAAEIFATIVGATNMTELISTGVYPKWQTYKKRWKITMFKGKINELNGNFQ